jgi:hypothetical protein
MLELTDIEKTSSQDITILSRLCAGCTHFDLSPFDGKIFRQMATGQNRPCTAVWVFKNSFETFLCYHYVLSSRKQKNNLSLTHFKNLTWFSFLTLLPIFPACYEKNDGYFVTKKVQNY